MSDSLSPAEIEALMASLDEDAQSGANPHAAASELSLDDFGALQAEIWPSVSQTVSEAAGKEITFANPLCVSETKTNLRAAFTQPVVVLSFSYSAQPDLFQTILFPQETILSLAGFLSETTPEVVDETVVEAVSPIIKAIATGLCGVVGRTRNEQITPEHLMLDLQEFSVDASFDQNDLVQTRLTIAAEGVEGTLSWLIDTRTALFLLGKEPVQASAPASGSSAISGSGQPHYLESAIIERLQEVPLQLDVELARVSLQFKEITELGTGSIIETDKLHDDLVEIFVDGCMVARGEVVVVDDCFGVRIVEILDPRDRLMACSARR